MDGGTSVTTPYTITYAYYGMEGLKKDDEGRPLVGSLKYAGSVVGLLKSLGADPTVTTTSTDDGAALRGARGDGAGEADEREDDGVGHVEH
jgi:hypothetical protein